jgi:hypothetical protein
MEMPSPPPSLPDLPSTLARPGGALIGTAGPRGATLMVMVGSEGSGGEGFVEADGGWTVGPASGEVLLVSMRIPAGRRLSVAPPPGTTTSVTRLPPGRKLALALEFDGVDYIAPLVSTYGLTTEEVRSHDNHALRRACETGRPDVAQWLTETYGLGPGDARAQDNYCLRVACRGGQLELARWLTARFGLGPDDARACNNYCLRFAVAGGHVHVAEWLVETFCLTAEDSFARASAGPALSLAAAAGSLEAAKWLVGRFSLATDPRARALHALETAQRHQQAHVASWVRETFRPCQACGALQSETDCRQCRTERCACVVT